MSSHLHNLALFLGHFHPVLVHLPIGSLVLLGVLELLTVFPRFKDAARNKEVILGFATASSAAAAACGWLLSRSGGYDAALLYWHRLAGLGVVGVCAMTWLLCLLNQQRAGRVSLMATLVLVVLAGHFGGQMSHGRDFLARYAPAPLRRLLGGKVQPRQARPVPADPAQRRPFAEVIQPILQSRCWPCHGPEKRKGSLCMESRETLLHGGENGPAIVPGKADESLMIRRLLLPRGHDDHMPPDGKPQPTPAEIGLLQWWINAGAPDDGTVGDLNPPAEVLRMLEAMSGGSR